jgi:hypothetical protein
MSYKYYLNDSKNSFWGILPRPHIQDYYLILQKHKWLFPFMQVRRWFSLIFGGRLKYGIREMKVNRNISQDNAENMSNFMENVGL